MKFLKGLAIGLLGILLFLSLTVFGLVLTINQTILNPDFVVSQVNKLDISSLAGEFLSEQIPSGQIPQGETLIADTLADLEPWIKDQTNAAIYSTYDYLLGESQSLSIVISTEQLKETLKDNLKSAFKQSLPPELAGLPQDMIDAEFDKYYQQFSEQIPTTIDIGEDMLGPEVMNNIAVAREYISYVQIAYKALIGFILLLIGLIILIHRQVRGATRQLGITFLIYGVPGYAGIFLLKNYAMAQLDQFIRQPNLPVSLQAWIPQFVDDFLAPLEMFTLGVLIGGVVLLIVSFVYKPRVPSF